MRLGNGPVQCTPFGSLFGRHPLAHYRCKEGHEGRLLQPPTWEAYRELLGARAEPRDACPPTVEAAECAPSLALPAMGSDGEPPTVEYADLVKVLEQVKDAAVAHLPSRLIVREASVPQDVQKRLKDYCLSSSHAGY